MLDFKATVKPKAGAKSADRFELAKDVAAFANTLGGTLLVGACGGSTLTSIQGVEEAEADWIAREYEEAVRDRCEPPPTVTVEKIPEGGKYIVAVHVLPFPFPVAVRVRGDKEDGYGDSAWVFFSRVASQNRPMRPEVPMMMTSEVRRISILLRSIPANDKVNVSTRTRHEGGRQDAPGCRIGTLDEMENRVTFLLDPDTPNGRRFSVPLDHVRTVFKDHDGTWVVDVEHFNRAR